MSDNIVEFNGCQYSRVIEKVFGVYQIRNLITGMVYIGSTNVSFLHRWRRHLQELIDNKHDNPKLQNAWNKYGAENFSFEVLSVCRGKKFVREVEQSFLGEADLSQLYNITPTAHLPPSRAGSVASEETREKMSKAHLGDKNHFFGKTHSEETKKKISQTNTGRKFTPEQNAKKGRKGRFVSEETKQKRSKSLKGNPKLIEAQKKRRLREKGCIENQET